MDFPQDAAYFDHLAAFFDAERRLLKISRCAAWRP
jgi:hypothetical protein